MENKKEIIDDFIQLARLALIGRQQDVQLLIHKIAKRYRVDYPNVTDSLIGLLQEAPTRSLPLRKQTDIPVPVDIDSRLQLLKIEAPVLDHDLILPTGLENSIHQIVAERQAVSSLLSVGLQPTKSVLFTGKPGVGKTMAAKWISAQLKKPLLILDLTAVMSSFLGKTGNNLRQVLDYAKGIDCVLLLDELDAIAKRRDDSAEVGELKRLVTVLLQEIDDWPASGLLIAATNHPDLLDPAVWRRFESILEFPMPSIEQIRQLATSLLEPHLRDADKWSTILSLSLKGKSFSSIEHDILLARRTSIVSKQPLEQCLELLLQPITSASHEEKLQLAISLIESGIVSQRRAHEITGIARETIRKYSTNKSVNSKNRKLPL